MMVTQLQNQDPTNPVSNSDLLGQMSQIGQLQSQTQLQSTLTNLGLQSQLGSGAGMIGKAVSGLDAFSNPISGTVQSVKVESGNVNLELDNGGELALTNVQTIAPATNGTTSTGSTPAAAN
jgi:flagellar basal-body rod modification protein FlgD